MLFLGDGASNAVGIGHLPILTKKVIRKLNNLKYSNTINDVIKGLNHKNRNNKWYKKN
jgi:hypothetical protein